MTTTTTTTTTTTHSRRRQNNGLSEKCVNRTTRESVVSLEENRNREREMSAGEESV
jgi:hypothetical protein